MIMTAFYRKLWIKHNGPIPVDEFGISYEIHHIDGNRANNDLSNLQCVSIAEHFKIHLSQGDYQAALLISEKIKDLEHLRQIGYTPKSLAAHMVEHELGLWSREAKAKSIQTKRDRQVGYCHDPKWASIGGKLGGAKGAAVTNEIHKQNGTGFYSSENQSRYGKLGAKAAAPKLLGIPKPILTCPHCGKEGGGHALMYRWHFDNCKSLRPEVTSIKLSQSEAREQYWIEYRQGLRKSRIKPKTPKEPKIYTKEERSAAVKKIWEERKLGLRSMPKHQNSSSDDAE